LTLPEANSRRVWDRIQICKLLWPGYAIERTNTTNINGTTASPFTVKIDCG